MHELLADQQHRGRRGRGRAVLAGARAVRPDRPGGVLPREGRLHPRGQEGLRRLRGPVRVPGVRAGQRRAVRHLGRAVRAGAPQAEEARRLVRDRFGTIVPVSCDSDPLALHRPRSPCPRRRSLGPPAPRSTRPSPPCRSSATAARQAAPDAGRRVAGRPGGRTGSLAVDAGSPTPAPTSSAPSEARRRAPFPVTVLQADRRHRVRRVRGAGRGTAGGGRRPRRRRHVALAAARRRRGGARGARRGCSTRPGARPRSPSPAPSSPTWADAGRLLEVGRPITRTGRRAGGPAAGEPDQGQHDHRTDVLAVASSGHARAPRRLRRPRRLRAGLRAARRGRRPGWRAHLAGHRVVVVPQARVREGAAAEGAPAPGAATPGAAQRAGRRQAA